MAQAMVTRIQDEGASGSNMFLVLAVLYRGADVPGGSTKSILTVTFADTATVGQIASAIQSAISTDATAKGFTVSANASIVPSYTRI